MEGIPGMENGGMDGLSEPENESKIMINER